MIVDEFAICVCYGLFNRAQLLCDINAIAAILDHRDDMARVSLRTSQAYNCRWMAGMRMCSRHGACHILPGGDMARSKIFDCVEINKT